MAYSDPVTMSVAQVPTHTQWNDYIRENLRSMNRWIAYTPIWTTNGAGADPILGNGSLTGAYIWYEQICFLEVQITIGSTTNTGVGGYVLSLPMDSYPSEIPNYRQCLPMVVLNDGLTWYFNYKAVITGEASVMDIFVTNTVPFTFGVNDVIHVNGFYRIA